MRLHEELKENEGKLYATYGNVRMLVKEAKEKGLDPRLHVKERTMSWTAPEDKGDAYARSFARSMGGVTIGELDQIIKETY